MPVMDGCTATALIRQMEAATSGPIDREPVPIVALTAFAMSRDRARCLQAGMDDYLTKPVECATLLKLVGRIARRGTTKLAPPLGTLATQPDGKGDAGDAGAHSPASDIPALEAHYRARVRKITRSLQQSAQRAQLPIVQLEAEQLLGLSVLPELRAVRVAVQRVLSLCATDPAAACTAVVEVAATVRAALGAEKDSPPVEPPVVVRPSSGEGPLLFRAPRSAVPTSFAPQNAERSSFAPTAAASAAASFVAAPAVAASSAASSSAAASFAAAPATAPATAPAAALAAAPAAAPVAALAAALLAPKDSAPAINLNDVRSTVGGSDAVMVRLLTKFNGRARATIDGMRRAVEESDWTTLKRDSHSLKGASGYVAAMALKAAAIALERSANESLEGPPVGTSPAEALVHVEEEMTRVLLAIGEATGEPPSWRASRPWAYAD